VPGALGALALTLMVSPSPASAAGTSTDEPISTFAVTSEQCAGGTQSPVVEDVQNLIDALNYPGSGSLLTLPTVSLNPGCTPAPSLLSSIINASNTVSSSPSGSASVSSEALGNPLLAEAAGAGVTFTASIPLSAPASSVDVSIPYTTTGVTMTPGGEAVALVTVELSNPEVITCSDGSLGTISPFNQSGDIDAFPILQDIPASSGTVSGIRFSCPDGSDLVSRLGFAVTVETAVHASSGHTESASANFDMEGVTATINP
jgi:hypothetical protein